ncbi:MAG: DNA repair protein RadC [Candidatus Moranbacteria bacterium]|nr:DNA repair protein RadC [Candidatus Moranbacteria bacterium]
MPKIKDLHKIERPREKMEKYGPEKLKDAELLAILLRTGTKGKNVVELSKEILRKFPDSAIAIADFKELKKTFGLGAAKAAEIVACFELGRRKLKNKKTALIMKPEDVFDSLKDIRDHKKEHFVVFYLDTRNQEICRETISIGTLNANLVHPREVFEPAIKNVAAHLIVAHNHPSGNPEPSDEDIEITKRLSEAAKIIGIGLLDHVIVAKDGYFSLKDEGMM